MRPLLQKLNFQKRLLLSFVLISFLPVLSVGIISYILYTNFIFKMAEKSSVETINLVCSDINTLFNDTYTLCNSLAGDIKMQKYLRMNFSSLSEQYSNDLAGSMELATISTYRKDIFGFYIIGNNGGRYKSNYSSFKTEDQRETRWYKSVISQDDALWFPSHMGSFVVRSSISDHFISVGIPFIDKASGQKSGIVIADIKEHAITKKIQNGIVNGMICMIDANGKILFQSESPSGTPKPEAVIDHLIPQILSAPTAAPGTSKRIDNKDYLIVSQALNNPNWQIAGIISKEQLTMSSRDITFLVMLILMAITILAFFIAMYISESISRPVRQLSGLMEAVERGDLSVRITDIYSDEFGRLNKNFNQMLDQIQILMDQIYQEQSKLRKSELKALQSQIQPHFLYNSLDSIIWLLRLKKNADAEKMLTEISTLFKISLSKGRDIISIREELQHITSYLIITNMIYSQKFEYTITCDISLYSYRTLKLLIQPLVENSINHAVPFAGQKIMIHVRIYEEQENLVLSVQDVGMGLKPDNLEKLKTCLSAAVPQETSKSGYGLYNVNERIHVFLGKEYGVRITSEYGYGTEVSVRIPKIKGDDHLVSGISL